MTINTKIFPPIDAAFFKDKRITRSWASYMQGIYDVTGASTGTIQFNNNNLQSKVTGRRLQLTSNNLLTVNGVVFMNQAKTQEHVLYADTSGSVNTGDPTLLGFGGSTGDIKPTFKNVADEGWIFLLDGSIGNSLSTATLRANDDCKNLFILMWNNVEDTYAPVSSGRGVDAETDFNLGKTLLLPNTPGRALISAGEGAGLNKKTLGTTGGVEEVVLTEENLPSHTHDIKAGPISGLGTNPTTFAPNTTVQQFTTGTDFVSPPYGSPYVHTDVVPEAHDNIQPTFHLNMMIKL